MSSKSRSRREAKQKMQYPAARGSNEKMETAPAVQTAELPAEPVKTKKNPGITMLKHACRGIILLGISYILVFLLWFFAFMAFFMIAFAFLDIPITSYFADILAFFVNISPAFFVLSVPTAVIWMVYIHPVAESFRPRFRRVRVHLGMGGQQRRLHRREN